MCMNKLANSFPTAAKGQGNVSRSITEAMEKINLYVCMYVCMYACMFIQMSVSIFTVLESIKVYMYVSVCMVRIKKMCIYVCL